MKTFIHRFSNGQTIRLDFDLDADQPYMDSNVKLNKQPVGILSEFRRWQNEVVVPELMATLTPRQLMKLTQMKK